MIDKNINDKHIETFVYDCERLFLLNFDNTEYEINQSCLTVRKLLIDSPGIMKFWNSFFCEKFKLFSATPGSIFDDEYLEKVKLYIPLLDILPKVVITNYTSIKLNDENEQKSVLTKTLEIIIKELDVNKFLTEKFLVINSKYITRKDIIEFISYGIGAIHFKISKNKIERIKTVEKLNFFYAMGNSKPDSMFFFSQGFRNKIDENFQQNPEYHKFLMTLGNRHSFESLMILQIVHEIRASRDFKKLYDKTKNYLIDNVFKFKNYDRNIYLTSFDRLKNAR